MPFIGLKIGTKPGSTFWLNYEPCGLICGCTTWLLIFFGMYATSAGVIIPWLGFSIHGILHLLLFNGFSLVALYTHIKVMSTDPGAVPPRAKPLADDDGENEYAISRELATDPAIPFKKYCRRCKAYKPQRAHHCSICGRCIVKMDHHCPWVNNCVGVGNHKLFLLFVFWIFVTCMYSLLLVLVKYIVCISDSHKCHGSSRNHLLVIFLVVESILFGLFTLCMLGDQLSAISSNQTQIDRLKGTKHNYQMEINEICGSARAVKCHYSWFIPAPVKFPEGNIRDKVLGYRMLVAGRGRDEEFNPLLEDGERGEEDRDNIEGDIEMGNIGHDSNNSNNNMGKINSSPAGGLALRKKMPQRNSKVDENDSNDSFYGAEEAISDWIDDPHISNTSSSSTATALGGASGSASNAALTMTGVTTTGDDDDTPSGISNGNGAADNHLLRDNNLAVLALGTKKDDSGSDDGGDLTNNTSGIIGGNNSDLSILTSGIYSGSGGNNSSNPSSPNVVMNSGAGSAQTHNTTRRKRTAGAGVA